MDNIEYSITDRLPESLNRDNIKEVAMAVDEELRKIDIITKVASIYPRIDELPSDLIDALAIQLHVDYYDAGLPLAMRRELVKKSIPWHLRKGTPGVVEDVVATVFGTNAEVQEWFDYGGKPYYFKVVAENVDITKANIAQMKKAISTVKNLRSWLEKIDFRVSFLDDIANEIAETAGTTLRIGGSSGIEDYYPWGMRNPDISRHGYYERVGPLYRDGQYARDGTVVHTGVVPWGNVRGGRRDFDIDEMHLGMAYRLEDDLSETPTRGTGLIRSGYTRGRIENPLDMGVFIGAGLTLLDYELARDSVGHYAISVTFAEDTVRASDAGSIAAYFELRHGSNHRRDGTVARGRNTIVSDFYAPRRSGAHTRDGSFTRGQSILI